MPINFDPAKFIETRESMSLTRSLLEGTMDNEREERRDRRAARKRKEASEAKQDRLDFIEACGAGWTMAQKARYFEYGEIPDDEEPGLPEIKGFTE